MTIPLIPGSPEVRNNPDLRLPPILVREASTQPLLGSFLEDQHSLISGTVRLYPVRVEHLIHMRERGLDNQSIITGLKEFNSALNEAGNLPLRFAGAKNLRDPERGTHSTRIRVWNEDLESLRNQNLMLQGVFGGVRGLNEISMQRSVKIYNGPSQHHARKLAEAFLLAGPITLHFNRARPTNPSTASIARTTR